MSAQQPAPQPPSNAASSTTPLRALVIHHVITLMLVVGALALGVWSYLTFRKRDFFYDGARGQVSPLEQHLERSQRARISLAVNAYYQLHNNWPLSLEQLIEEGLLESSDLRYPSPQVTYTLRVEDGRPILDARRETPPTAPAP
jgi:hypothetical protein